MAESLFIEAFVIQANEVLLKSKDRWLRFARPVKIVAAGDVGQVVAALREVERAVQSDHLHAAGFLSYESAPAFDPALRVLPGRDFPLIWFGLYPEPEIVSLPEPASAPANLNWKPTVSREKYNAAIETIKERIAEGMTYQVNYTMRLRADFSGGAWEFFLKLARSQNKYAAFVNTGRYIICSASPELFFELDGDLVASRPMKGTTRRGRTTLEDREQARRLNGSKKNRAENVMIVDMIRNDLGRIAEVGSVRVPELFAVEKYPTLWQMTSTVQARTSASPAEIFTALFPCASITGAPKVSTMRVISELETTPRRIYTGSIGFIAPGRQAQFNVAIRTALIDTQTGQAEYGVGGGIVWDSASADEYAEALLKARVLTEENPRFSLLETMRWTPEEGFFLREKHLARLLDSAEYFDFPVSRREVEEYLDELESGFACPQRIRLLVDREGNITVETEALKGSAGIENVRVADEPVDSNNIFLFHKTTRREVYENARKKHPDCDEVLLCNENGELTEFTTGNLIVEMDGGLYTPPLSCGLLPGAFRAHLLETGHVRERAIRKEDLAKCAKIFLVNSVRKWVEVKVEQSP
jgi:para-aminobenzoate synthetase/4-amino-4-deoxychorismate lyase